METFYLFLIIFLFVLAVFDLSVGVSNDAVNFMNSAIGSKAASFKVIMVIAAIGIFVGASLSNGMMDIARHGIYQPQHFYFSEIMCILLAVMLTDVVLLDIFNSLGMPTSTTVSLVFELLGGTVAISLIKIANSNGALQLGDLLNTDKALRDTCHFSFSGDRFLFRGHCSIHFSLDFYFQLQETHELFYRLVRWFGCHFHLVFHVDKRFERKFLYGR